VLVSVTAARLERRGVTWLSARELAVDEERWAIRHRHDYGYTTTLPDLVGWAPGSDKAAALVCEETRRRDDRQTWVLEGWHNAVTAGRYEFVQYDCVNEPLAHWIKRLGKKIHFTHPELHTDVQTPLGEIHTLPPAEAPAKAEPEPEAESPRPALRLVERAAATVPSQERAPEADQEQAPKMRGSLARDDTPEEAAARRQRINEILGIEEQKPKRRWLR
jgi:hypothetical protein